MNLHWQLDFTFRDDKNTSMAKTGVKNLQIIKKIVLSILRLVKESYKLSMKRIRYELSHGLLKDTEDFYENKHTNSDLLSVNFTSYSDEEIYEALYHANTRLIKRYEEIQSEKSEQICRELYYNKNSNFRGFRQT